MSENETLSKTMGMQQAYPNLELQIKEACKYLIPKKEGPDYSTKEMPFEDDIIAKFDYWRIGYDLNEKVLENIDKCKGKTNIFFGNAIFDRIIKEVYRQIKKRNGPIINALDSYLIKEDFDCARQTLDRLLNSSHKKHRIILMTNLIHLKDITELCIGNVEIKYINDEYIKNMPEDILSSNLFALPSFGKNKTNKDTFFKEKDRMGKTAFEVDVIGFHLNDERSYVLELAIDEFKRVFSYLLACEYRLGNINNPYKMTTKEINNTYFSMIKEIGEQDYYIRMGGVLTQIEKDPSPIFLSNKIIEIDKELIKHLNARCGLEKFNSICTNNDCGDIRNKIILSLDWYLKAKLEDNLTDNAINLSISLETLMSVGAEPLTAYTDELAENIALMMGEKTADKRYEHKYNFKNRVYKLRCNIMHNGYTVDYKKDIQELYNLEAFYVWSLFGIISRIDAIKKIGIKTKNMKKYFELEKLK